MTLAEPDAPREVAGTWVGDELARTLARVDALTRALEAVQGGQRMQQEEIARLADQLQTVDGRSQRHERAQDATRDACEEIARLEAALEGEASLRRDLAARVEQGVAREAETQRELRRVLGVIAARLDGLEGQQAAIDAREQHLREAAAARAVEDEGVEARLAELERRVAAEQEGARRGADEMARFGTTLPDLVARVEELAGRMRAAQVDVQRTVEEVSALSAIRDREAALLDVLEQQRVTRARMEDRLTTAEEALEAAHAVQALAAEAVTRLTRDFAGEAEQRRALAERIDAQRDLVSDHLRRVLRAEEEGARRRIDEIERDMRATRGLLVRLDEAATDAAHEQPL
ncbi:MAG: hypothetical protein EXR64_05415 [Dehalococcoidia bacterium]|nr:hypothetical protein [Dehalococcoidia bacterium]